MQFNGVILLSSIMNYGVRDAGFDQIYVTYCPATPSPPPITARSPKPATWTPSFRRRGTGAPRPDTGARWPKAPS
jgi:hypothetical protein